MHCTGGENKKQNTTESTLTCMVYTTDFVDLIHTSLGTFSYCYLLKNKMSLELHDSLLGTKDTIVRMKEVLKVGKLSLEDF